MAGTGEPRIAAVVVAAGAGTRFGSTKHDLSLDGIPVWRHSVTVLSDAGIDPLTVVGDVPGGVAGGERRRDSVMAGLETVRDSDWVLIHDGARPLVPLALIDRVLMAIRDRADIDGVVPAIPITDTVKRVDGDRRIVETVDRSQLVAVQTPQAFRTSILLDAHTTDPDDDVTDDAGLVERVGGTVIVVDGDPDNIKITYPDDLARARAILERRRAS